VLVIDVDDDVGRKAHVHTPVLGVEQLERTALSLGSADPQDSDVNAILAGVQVYKELRDEGKEAFVALLSGDARMGIHASRRIAEQLREVIEKTGVKSCILVTDGRSDEEVLPIIKAQLPIIGTKLVVVKQAKELEKTYFVILEKLRDPYFARILLGVPAILILLFSLSSFFGWGWQPIAFVVGLYLLAKGFGWEHYIHNVISDFTVSFTRVSWPAYLVFITLSVVAGVSAVNYYNDLVDKVLFVEKAYAGAVKLFISVFPWAFLILLVGKVVDAVSEGKRFKVITYATYAYVVVLASFLIDVVCTWILNEVPPFITFGQVLWAVALTIVLALLLSRVLKVLKIHYLLNQQLIGKRVLTQRGSGVGKVIGLNTGRAELVVSTLFNKREHIPLERVVEVSEEGVVI